MLKMIIKKWKLKLKINKNNLKKLKKMKNKKEIKK